MTQYLLSVWMDPTQPQPSPEETQKMYADVDVFNEKLQAQGSWVFAGGLHPASTATVVQVKDGETLTTDGPYAETKEQLGGFWLIEARDLNEAVQIAGRLPPAQHGSVEVRPVWDIRNQERRTDR
jgi:hypothetical protein